MTDHPTPGSPEELLETVTEALLRLDMRMGQLVYEVELPPADDELWAFWRPFAALAIKVYTSALEGHPHVYLSTGCLHGNHEYCKGLTGAVGAKIPAQCKFCQAGCVCFCHLSANGVVTVVERIVNPHAGWSDPIPDALCGAEPPGGAGTPWASPDDVEGTWGDCDCTRSVGHKGDHRCGPCAERYGAPSWPQEEGEQPPETVTTCEHPADAHGPLMGCMDCVGVRCISTTGHEEHL
jgi:hypothetical protein